MLPLDFPPFNTVFYYFNKWKLEGVFEELLDTLHVIVRRMADGGYKGQKLIDTVKQKLGAEFTVVLRPDESSKKFNVLPFRWIVEGSFSWLESFGRIAMDYEFYSDTGEAMVQLAFCRLKSTIEI